MPTNVIPNGEVFSFTVGGRVLDLHGNLQQIQSSDKQDVAIQRIIKRDGAIVEGMGWQERHFVAKLYFVGLNFRAEVTALHAALRVNSEGTLNHPLYGSVQARCTQIDDDLDVVMASNGCTVTLQFAEAGLDASVLSSTAQGVPAKAQAIDDANANATIFESVYPTAADSLETLTDASSVYAAAALAAAQTGTPDPSLPSALGQVGIYATAAVVAIQADPAASLDVDRFDAIAAAQLVYAACLDLNDALLAAAPPASYYTIPAPISYLALAGQRWGKDGLSRAEEILQLNPHVTTPHLIPAGTVLVLAAPTV